MGNKLSCSCAPLIKKGYRYEDSPWQANARGRMSGGPGERGRGGEGTGHLLRCGSLRERKRLWAEVFHVTSGAGSVKWQQVSEDLVPVNITCIQDTPETIFHITAYNCQVDKILDVRLVQPGTRIGQASECFVYWKDTMTNDTWGLNFTCAIDAKQFKETVSPSFKISRKASSSYSLRLEPLNKQQQTQGSQGQQTGNNQQKVKARRKPVSTPASPSRGSREPQCTCMTPEQFNRLRQDPRYRSTCGMYPPTASTLPRIGVTRSVDVPEMGGRTDKITAATSSASLYDNVNNQLGAAGPKILKSQDSIKRGEKQQQNEICQTNPKTATVGIGTANVGSQIDAPEDKLTGPSPKKPIKLMRQDSATQNGPDQILKSEGTQAGEGMAGRYYHRKDTLHHTKSADYSELEMQSHMFNNNMQGTGRRNKSKSTDDMRLENAIHLQHRPPSGMMMHPSMTMGVPPQHAMMHQHPGMEHHTMKRVFKPMSSIDSPVTSPEMTRKRHSHHYHYHPNNNNQKYVMSEVENDNYVHAYNIRHPYPTRFQQTRNVHSMEIDRQYSGIAGRRVSLLL